MTLVAALIFVVLTMTALLHIAWAFGVTWPAKDEQALVNAVLGVEGASKLPPLGLTLVVAGGMIAAGIIALWGAGVVSMPFPDWIRSAGLAVLAAIFLLRGVVTYLPFPMPASQPFYRLNRLFSSF
ncbi:DUF3995 domain-containing protein [Profundibacter sp.]|uniref:DUF3995 domain-containing protein n=1 Tax=Profundibacter sp. TaxID=3101071 RepID=UPI003D099493